MTQVSRHSCLLPPPPFSLPSAQGEEEKEMSSAAVPVVLGDTSDVEKHDPVEQHGQYQRHGKLVSMLKVDDGEVYESHPEKNPRWYQRILDVGVEENGIKPVPVEKRTDKRFYNLFTVMFTALMCLLP